jgi:hypothetical protein
MLKVKGGRRILAELEGCVVNQILVQVLQEEAVDGIMDDDACVR